MFVCICNSVSDHDIEEAVWHGDDSFESVREKLGVASCCGKCQMFAREVIEEAKSHSAEHTKTCSS